MRIPQGGMFLWLEVPGFSSMYLFEELAAQNVITVPGVEFAVPSLVLHTTENKRESSVQFEELPDPGALRIAFAACSSDMLKVGGLQLAKTIRRILMRKES